MVFSTNQARHLYVAKTFKDAVTESDVAKTLAIGTDSKNHVYLVYKGADTLLRSDLIALDSIQTAALIPASKSARKLKAVDVTLCDKVNGGEPVPGQDYVVRILFRQFAGMSDEDEYFKYGTVRAFKGMTASDFYKVLAHSFALNLCRDVSKLVKISLVSAAGTTDVEASTKLDALTDDYTAVRITEIEQEWVPGVKASEPVFFEVYPTTITFEGGEPIWGHVEPADSEVTVGNGKLVADMEYFYMKERGDQYGLVGWPYVIPTKYLVDPTKEYTMIDIHYSYVGSNENIQKSEKTLTIACETESVANSIVAALKKAGVDVISVQ
jgi:hypothetical protein